MLRAYAFHECLKGPLSISTWRGFPAVFEFSSTPYEVGEDLRLSMHSWPDREVDVRASRDVGIQPQVLSSCFEGGTAQL